jgi:uncharacterized membrane protein YhhN
MNSISGSANWWKILALLAVITTIEILADFNEMKWLLYATKPLLLSLLLLWFFVSISRNRADFKFIFFGLIFSLFGDVFLMIREVDLFIPGLISFLTAHVFYILSFVKSIQFAERNTTAAYKMSTAIVFLSFVGLFLGFLLPYVMDNESTKDLLIPVIVYAFVITLMGYMAAQRRYHVPMRSFRAVLFGSVFFILSDCILATNKFAFEVELATLWIMSTYVFAQFLIVYGTMLLFEKLKEDEKI